LNTAQIGQGDSGAGRLGAFLPQRDHGCKVVKNVGIVDPALFHFRCGGLFPELSIALLVQEVLPVLFPVLRWRQGHGGRGKFSFDEAALELLVFCRVGLAEIGVSPTAGPDFHLFKQGPCLHRPG
jgi:hypothetical protein